MDNDDLRRGRPTCHIQFDEATAILAGDALLARAFEVLTSDLMSAGLPVEWIVDANRTLAAAAGATGLVGGQADDLAGQLAIAEETDLAATARLQQLESIHRRKTGTCSLLLWNWERSTSGHRQRFENHCSLTRTHLGWLFRSLTICSTIQERAKKWANGRAKTSN